MNTALMTIENVSAFRTGIKEIDWALSKMEWDGGPDEFGIAIYGRFEGSLPSDMIKRMGKLARDRQNYSGGMYRNDNWNDMTITIGFTTNKKGKQVVQAAFVQNI